MEIRTHLQMKGYFPFIRAFKGTRVITVDPLRPDLEEAEDAPIMVLEHPGTERILQKAEGPDEFPNTILNSGRNAMATQASWLIACQVGTDSTAPVATQTSLLSKVSTGHTISVQNDVWGSSGAVPWYHYRRKTWRFDTGDAAGNLNEIAVGWSVTDGDIICRHRTVNSVNQETQITVNSDEYLDATYELRYYPPLDDVTGTITLNSVVYDTITRASNVDDSSIGERIGTGMASYGTLVSDWYASDAELGSITSAPGATIANHNTGSYTEDAYSTDSYQIRCKTTCGSSGWNLGAGIRSIRFRTTAGDFQCRFGSQVGDNEVPKTSSFTMTIGRVISWGEFFGIKAVAHTMGVTGQDATLTGNP